MIKVKCLVSLSLTFGEFREYCSSYAGFLGATEELSPSGLVLANEAIVAVDPLLVLLALFSIPGHAHRQSVKYKQCELT